MRWRGKVHIWSRFVIGLAFGPSAAGCSDNSCELVARQLRQCCAEGPAELRQSCEQDAAELEKDGNSDACQAVLDDNAYQGCAP